MILLSLIEATMLALPVIPQMGEVRPLLMNKTNGRTRTQGCDSIVEWKDKSAYT